MVQGYPEEGNFSFRLLGAPFTGSRMPESPSPIPEQKFRIGSSVFLSPTELRILVDIRMSNGCSYSVRKILSLRRF